MKPNEQGQKSPVQGRANHCSHEGQAEPQTVITIHIPDIPGIIKIFRQKPPGMCIVQIQGIPALSGDHVQRVRENAGAQ